MEARGLNPLPGHFLLQRFISAGYYALVNFTKATPAGDAPADACKWHDMNSLPPLIQDHGAIIQKALTTLRENLAKSWQDSACFPMPLPWASCSNFMKP